LARHTRYQGLIIKDRRVLLIKHGEHATGRGYWVIPGGGIDGNESEEQCVVREMKEETNLEVKVAGLLFEEPGHPEEAYHWPKTYLCKPISGEASPGYEPELEAAENYAITEVGWFDLQDESDWEPELIGEPITYPQLVKARRKLGYLSV
jgi:ADP-ribose pyrophosphatase YjhB (NUDIX family)